jgi:hypothetical protein
MTARVVLAAVLLSLSVGISAVAEGIDGQPDNERDDLGYYYIMTGGKFPTGAPPDGNNGSGGTFRFLLDDPGWGGYPLGQWNKDDWFPENASFALTLKNGGSIVYDNNGLEDGSYGGFYDYTDHLPEDNWATPGLYRGYAMSNNWDWIYAGYFKLEEETAFDTIIGYWDDAYGFDPDSPEIAYDMNMWSAYQDNPTGNPDSWMPVVNDFTGDVFSSKASSGTFTWSYTGVDRVFPAWSGYPDDPIWRLTYTLDQPMTLPAGVYFFGHDAEIVEPSTVPEPAALALVAMGALGLLLKGRA